MDTIIINSENCKTSKAHILMHKLTNELDLKMGEKINQDYQVLVFITLGKS